MMKKLYRLISLASIFIAVLCIVISLFPSQALAQPYCFTIQRNFLGQWRYTCVGGCDTCQSDGTMTCCNGESGGKCVSKTFDCDENTGGANHYPPTPWYVSGKKTLYKGVGSLGNVRNTSLEISQIDHTVRYANSTTGQDDYSFEFLDVSNSSGYTKDILDAVFTFTTTLPFHYDAYATYCKNLEDTSGCHTDSQQRYGSNDPNNSSIKTVDIDLEKAGGELSLLWHYVAPPTGLKVQCNELGTQATLSWDAYNGVSSFQARAIKKGDTFTCNSSSNGPSSICRDVTSTSTSLNVTPGSKYDWSVFPETYEKAAGVSNFTCGPAPSGFLHTSDPNCTDFSGRYQLGQPISHYAYVQSGSGTENGLGSSKIMIAKEAAGGTTLNSYTAAATPSWCTSMGGTMMMNGGIGIFCQIESKVFAGETDQQTFDTSWTPSEPGVYYTVINVTSTSLAILQCSSNPMCEYSPSNLNKLPGKTCGNARFSPCQTGVLANRMQDLTISQHAQGGELIRVTVAAPGTCDGPKPICGKVTLPDGTAVSGKPITISSTAGVTKVPLTTSAGQFSNIADFISGSTYSVSLGGTPPAGYYAPLVPSITGQTLGGVPSAAVDNCAANCVTGVAPTCDFVYRSCDEISPITLAANPIEFVPIVGGYQPVDISWTQVVAAGLATSFDVKLKAGSLGAEISIIPSSITPSDEGLITRFSTRISSDVLKQLHKDLTDEGTDIVHITVVGARYADPYCQSTGYQAITPPATQPIPTTEQVTVGVRQTAANNICTGGTAVSTAADPLGMSGNMVASVPPTGPNLISTYTPNNDNTITVSTGSSITAQYSFTSPYFTCNTVLPACSGITESIVASTKTCSKTSSADSNGKILLYVSQLEVKSWWEASGGMVYGKDSISSSLPVNSLGFPLLCTDRAKCDPFLVRSATFAQNLRAGLPISQSIGVANGWRSERKQSSPLGDKENQSASDGGTPSLDKIKDNISQTGGSLYTYYRNLAESKTTISNSGAGGTSSTLPGVPGFYQLGVDGSNTHKFTPSSTQTVASGKSLVMFVNGDLEISGNPASTPIKVDSGGFLAFIVKGKITIDQNVGTTLSTASMPDATMGVGSSPPANLAGMYISDGNIIIQSDTSATPDKRFVGEGSFISMSGFELPRKYARSGDPFSYFVAGFTPIELFRHRPDMVLSTPPELRENLIQYQEIN